MKFILGKKLDMTQVWQSDDVVAVTRVQAGPCMVVQVKNKEKDGYEAVQIGFGEKKKKNIKKPQRGHLHKLEVRSKKSEVNLRYLREFRLDKNGEESKVDLKIGDVIDVATFTSGDIVKVTSTSKGKGFQGVVKRHGFHGAPKSHGTKDQLRMPGSIGATGPAHVFKGKKMPGRMGDERVTVTNLEVIEVDKENNELLIKGAVPGARNGLILIQGEGDLKIKQIATDKQAVEIEEQKNRETEKQDNKETKEQKDRDIEKQKSQVENEDKEDIEEVVVEADKRRQETVSQQTTDNDKKTIEKNKEVKRQDIKTKK